MLLLQHVDLITVCTYASTSPLVKHFLLLFLLQLFSFYYWPLDAGEPVHNMSVDLRARFNALVAERVEKR